MPRTADFLVSIFFHANLKMNWIPTHMYRYIIFCLIARNESSFKVVAA